MIEFVQQKYSFSPMYAETDHEALRFYEKCGFAVKSLGEKYPGVERFYCEKRS